MIKKVFLFFFVLFIGINNVYANERVNVTLHKCVDGDTAWFSYKDEIIKARFLAINTPESTTKKEPFGKEASTFTCDSLKNAKNIVLEYDSESDKKDKYDRDLVWVWVDNTLLQEKLLENGLAEIKYLYGDYKYTDKLEVVEAKAKEKRINIWQDLPKEENDTLILILGIIIIIALLFTKKGRNKLLKIFKKEIKKFTS